MLKNFVFSIALFHLVGCVGFTTHTGTETSVQQFSWYQAGREGLVKDKETAIKFWGEPTSKSRDESGAEKWVYRGGLAWRGVTIWAFIPVPIMAPVGNNYVEMTFSPSGKLTYGTAEGMNEKGVVCYLIYLECNPEELP